MNKKTTAAIILAIGIAVGPMTGTAATADVLGSGPDAGGVAIEDGAVSRTHQRTVGTFADGGGGSFWQWGVGTRDTWSNYFRESRCHGATAVGKKTKRVSNVPGGKYAKALTPKASSGNKAYYHNC